MPPMYSAEIFLQSWMVDSLAPSTEEGLTESPMLQRNCDQILICGWSREVLRWHKPANHHLISLLGFVMPRVIHLQQSMSPDDAPFW